MYDSGISSIQNAGATTYRLRRHPLQALNMSLNTIKIDEVAEKSPQQQLKVTQQ
jgi:hypothetical protein